MSAMLRWEMQLQHQRSEKIVERKVYRENSGKKSLLSRVKQSLGRAIHKAAKLSGFRQSSEPKTKAVNESKLIEHEMKPVKVPQEIVSQFSPPDMSEPSFAYFRRLAKCSLCSLASSGLGEELAAAL